MHLSYPQRVALSRVTFGPFYKPWGANIGITPLADCLFTSMTFWWWGHSTQGFTLARQVLLLLEPLHQLSPMTF
jgi:hypothetical protein